jgi:hypothetical protein
MAMNWLTNIYLWISIGLLFFILFILLFIFLVVMAKKTHMLIEFKAWMKGKPIALFFMENRFCEWKPVEPDAGIVIDKNFGAFIINERATYIDKRTKAVLIPFDSNFGASVNIHAAKLADDLQYIVKDDEQMGKLRHAISHNLIDENETINVLKTSIHLGAIKTMMTALIPHNINAKIEKIVASRMKGMGQINVPQIALIFVAIFGAILLGAMIIKLAFNK